MPTEETITREYRVSVPTFFMWPVHIIAWLIATVVRAVALVLLITLLVFAYGWWQDHNATAPPTLRPAVCHTVAT